MQVYYGEYKVETQNFNKTMLIKDKWFYHIHKCIYDDGLTVYYITRDYYMEMKEDDKDWEIASNEVGIINHVLFNANEATLMEYLNEFVINTVNKVEWVKEFELIKEFK